MARARLLHCSPQRASGSALDDKNKQKEDVQPPQPARPQWKSFVTLIPSRLSWAVHPSLDRKPNNVRGVPAGAVEADAAAAAALQLPEDTHRYFTVDHEMVYDPFYRDFGPLNLGQVYRFCEMLNDMMQERRTRRKQFVLFCANNSAKKANSAFLICAYMIVIEGQTPDQAWMPFEVEGVKFLPYRDATYGLCTYGLKIIDCLRGLAHAIQLGWFDFKQFPIAQYEYHEKLANGDLNWIIPNKFIAFSGPIQPTTQAEDCNIFSHRPETYVDIFTSLGVTLVIRLNKKQYCRRIFTRNGIAHVDLYFLDGSCPTREILDRFLNICENHPGAIAVHCKAGLGRTGTLIGCYAMKHYGFGAAEWIGWNRICRPGSVLGPQQYFLHEVEAAMHESNLPLTHARTTTADFARILAKEDRQGDKGQGDRLVSAKRHHRRDGGLTPPTALRHSASASTNASTPTTATPVAMRGLLENYPTTPSSAGNKKVDDGFSSAASTPTSGGHYRIA